MYEERRQSRSWVILGDKSMKLIKYIIRAFCSYRHGYTADEAHIRDLASEVYQNHVRQDGSLIRDGRT